MRSGAVRVPAAAPGRVRPGRSTLASVALAATAFVVVTGESTPIGLITSMARGLHTSESRVGLTVSGYALVGAVTAVPLTRLARRIDRRALLVSCALVFVLGHVVAGCAPNLAVLMAGRGLAALGHGVYFAVAAPAAVRLAPPEVRGRAGGWVAVGATSAFVVGTPLATLLGQAAGWRMALFAVAALAAASGLVVRWVLPSLPALERGPSRTAGGVRAALRAPGLRTVLAVTFVVVTAHFMPNTYIAPYVGERFDVRGATFTVLLLAYGTAAVGGSTLAARLADRCPVPAVRWAAAGFTAALVGLWLAGRLRAPTAGVPLLVAWGGAFSLTVVLAGLAVLRRAAGERAETANALYGIVFQVGIVAGSALGSLGVAAGELTTLPLIAAGGGLLALAIVTVARSAFGHGAPAPGAVPFG